MKTFYSFMFMCLVVLCAPFSESSAKAASGITENVLTGTTTADCDCDNNVLTNAGFENGFNGWTKSGSWTQNTSYEVCGTYAGVLEGAGYIYQQSSVAPGATVTLSAYGGYHKKKGQTFKMSFYTSDNVFISEKTVAVDWDVDVAPSNGPILKQYTLTGTAPSNAAFVRAQATSEAGDWFKVDAFCMQITRPAANCGCDNNVLTNASFENGFNGWTKTGTWTQNTTYDVCGTYAAVLEGAGTLYQQYQVAPGAVVNFSVYGGYHVQKGQTFKLSFYNSSNTFLSGKTVAVDWDVDTAPANTTILKQYVLNATAPANTAYVRAEAVSNAGDWFKIDAACMQVTPPPADCNCDGNALVNASFEDYTTASNGTKIPTGWSSSNDAGQIFTDDGGYNVCGNRNGLLGTSGGSFWQDVNVIPGSTAVLNIWGGYHVNKSHKFQLIYLNASKAQIGAVAAEVALNKAVESLPATGPNGMTKYTLTAGAAPAGTSYIRVLGSATGDYFKVDAACLKITPPVCETCTGNQMVNPSFEDGITSWTKTGAGTFATSTDYVVCGTKSAKLTDKVTISQSKSVAPGNTVSWTMYAGYEGTASVQTLKIRFYNGSTELTPQASWTQNVDKAVTATTLGLKKYSLTAQAPATATSVVLEISSSAGILYCDLGCFTIRTDTPLPVTLTDFSVKKEGTVAALSWKTTAETNSKSFEVQHSLNGKEWAVLGNVDAYGESSTTKTYNYTHATPSNGNNLYRLKMIDNDETFAFSRIVSQEFVTEDAAILYPNPSSNYMKLRPGREKIASIQIYDNKGVKVRDFAPKDSADVDISNLAVGSYIVTFKQSNGLVTKQRIEVIR